MADNKAPLYCSFCGKSQFEVATLVAGPKVFICNECVELCTDICEGGEVYRIAERISRFLFYIRRAYRLLRGLPTVSGAKTNGR